MNTKSAPFENVPNNKFYRTIAIVVAVAVVAIALVVVVPKVMSGGKAASSAVGGAVDNVKDNATGPIADAMRNDPAYDGSPVTAIDNPDKALLSQSGLDTEKFQLKSVRYQGMNWYFRPVQSGYELYLIVYDKTDKNGQRFVTVINNGNGPISSYERY
jgi:hypothetical protein